MARCGEARKEHGQYVRKRDARNGEETEDLCEFLGEDFVVSVAYKQGVS